MPPISKAQYEKKFKEWGFAKYSTGQEWKAVSYHVLKRKREGKETDVYRDGKLIPPEKVRKRISRYSFQTAWQRHTEGESGPSFNL